MSRKGPNRSPLEIAAMIDAIQNVIASNSTAAPTSVPTLNFMDQVKKSYEAVCQSRRIPSPTPFDQTHVYASMRHINKDGSRALPAFVAHRAPSPNPLLPPLPDLAPQIEQLSLTMESLRSSATQLSDSILTLATELERLTKKHS